MTVLDDVTTGADAFPGPERIEPRATISLALAIVACLTGTIVPAIVALPLAGVAERRIWASDGRLGGTGRIRWARRLSQLGIAIGIVAFLTLLFVTQRSGLSNLRETFFKLHFIRSDFGTIA